MLKKIRSAILIITAAFSGGPFLLGSVSISFSDTGIGEFASGFSNASGVPTTGMSFGLVVDTANDGFSSGSWDPFDISSRSYLSTSGIQSDDYFTFGTGGFGDPSPPPFLTQNASPLGGDAGTIIDMTGIDVKSEPLEGKPYGVLWLANGTGAVGSQYGFLNSTLNMPNDGSTVIESSTFSLELSPGAANFEVIPEPSAYATILGLLGFGYAVFCRRRRSSSQE